MLRYRSDLLKVLETLLLLPAYLTGLSEQRQLLEVELFSNYVENPVSHAPLLERCERACFHLFFLLQYSPSVTAVIEILSNQVQIYSSQLNIHADFTGIRYDSPRTTWGSDDKRKKLVFDIQILQNINITRC